MIIVPKTNYNAVKAQEIKPHINYTMSLDIYFVDDKNHKQSVIYNFAEYNNISIPRNSILIVLVVCWVLF